MGKKIEIGDSRIKAVKAFTYIGGKSRYINELYSYFPKDYTSFYDVCGGSGVVALSLKPPSMCKKIVLNDIDDSIYNFYETLKGKDGGELEKCLVGFDYHALDKLEWIGYSESVDSINFKGGIEAAIAVYIQIVSSFSGMRKDYIRKEPEYLKRFAEKNIPLVRQRLQNIEISNRDFIDILEEVEDDNAFIYIDVPYRMETREGSALYKCELEEERHEDMLQILINAPYMWALSGYRKEGLFESDKYDIILGDFSDYTIEIPTWKYAANKKIKKNMFEDSFEELDEDFEVSGGKPKANEILWRNYK